MKEPCGRGGKGEGRTMTIPMGGRQTDEVLLERLRESARRPLTKREVAAQRISWVYGNLPDDSTLTRDEVARIIEAHEGE
jgi:hypothetical protein